MARYVKFNDVLPCKVNFKHVANHQPFKINHNFNKPYFFANS
ncbi:Domain of unknown function (DUF1845) [Moritella viscosa]|nr:Domain of unknown function (DUF1845) [Moritella viscosa]